MGVGRVVIGVIRSVIDVILVFVSFNIWGSLGVGVWL